MSRWSVSTTEPEFLQVSRPHLVLYWWWHIANYQWDLSSWTYLFRKLAPAQRSFDVYQSLGEEQLWYTVFCLVGSGTEIWQLFKLDSCKHKISLLVRSKWQFLRKQVQSWMKPRIPTAYAIINMSTSSAMQNCLSIFPWLQVVYTGFQRMHFET